jgi:hypothetical protein
MIADLAALLSDCSVDELKRLYEHVAARARPGAWAAQPCSLPRPFSAWVPPTTSNESLPQSPSIALANVAWDQLVRYSADKGPARDRHHSVDATALLAGLGFKLRELSRRSRTRDRRA